MLIEGGRGDIIYIICILHKAKANVFRFSIQYTYTLDAVFASQTKS